jgi:hypothetical protein
LDLPDPNQTPPEGIHAMPTNTDQHPRRFSEGMEHLPSLAASARAGSFADGMAMAAVPRAGTFADGLALRPDAPAARRIGSFGDVEPPVRRAPAWPRLRVARRPRPQAA